MMSSKELGRVLEGLELEKYEADLVDRGLKDGTVEVVKSSTTTTVTDTGTGESKTVSTVTGPDGKTTTTGDEPNDSHIATAFAASPAKVGSNTK